MPAGARRLLSLPKCPLIMSAVASALRFLSPPKGSDREAGTEPAEVFAGLWHVAVSSRE
jgi:hypothetical protein